MRHRAIILRVIRIPPPTRQILVTLSILVLLRYSQCGFGFCGFRSMQSVLERRLGRAEGFRFLGLVFRMLQIRV